MMRAKGRGRATTSREHGPGQGPDSREHAIRLRCAEGRYDLAFAAAWKVYRAEMFRFLVGMLHDEDAAQEVFSSFSEELWKCLPGFRWESSFRTWSYRLLRAACFRYVHSPKRREQPVSSPVPEEEAANQTTTRPWLQTDARRGFAALRRALEPEDQLVLLLRIDQKMAWTEIALISDGGEGPSTEAEVRRKAAALRQHFHRIKEQLRKMALDAGLLSPAGQ